MQPTKPVWYVWASFLSSFSYPIPIHSIQIFTAFVKTTATSPRQIPKIIIRMPTAARAIPVHLEANRFFIRCSSILPSLSVLFLPSLSSTDSISCSYSPALISSSCFSTISFQPSRLLLPMIDSPTIFPALSTKKDSGKD